MSLDLSLFATFASFAAYFFPSIFSFSISLSFSLISLISGFQYLRIIHKNPDYFKGEWTAVVSIVLSSLVLLINLFFVFISLFGDYLLSPSAVNISSEESAIQYANNHTDINAIDLSDMNISLKLMNSDALEIIASDIKNFTDISRVYLVSWKKIYEINITEKCSIMFTYKGAILKSFQCIFE